MGSRGKRTSQPELYWKSIQNFCVGDTNSETNFRSIKDTDRMMYASYRRALLYVVIAWSRHTFLLRVFHCGESEAAIECGDRVRSCAGDRVGGRVGDHVENAQR